MTDEYLTGPNGTYRLLQRIGSGGMGVVHLALDEDGRTLAVKELHPGLIDEDMLRRFEREVASMHRVTSPYVAEIRDADVRGERPFVATRYVQGRPLDRTVRERGPLTGSQLVHVARHLATALQVVHDAGIIHRDLKPSNVMLSEGMPVIIDFGIAQAIDSTRLTHTGVVVGTPGYVAPEIVNGGEAGQPADVFAWAATVAYAATGRSPFGTGPAEVVFFRVAGGQSDLHGVPEPLLPILRSALARDPGARPTAAELAERLATVRLDPPEEDAASADPEDAGAPDTPKPGATGAAAAVAAAATGLPGAAESGTPATPEPGTSGTPETGTAGAAAEMSGVRENAAPAAAGTASPGTPQTGMAGAGEPSPAEASGAGETHAAAQSAAAGDTGDMHAAPVTGETATEPVRNGPPPDRLETGQSAPARGGPSGPQPTSPPPPWPGRTPGGPAHAQTPPWSAAGPSGPAAPAQPGAVPGPYPGQVQPPPGRFQPGQDQAGRQPQGWFPQGRLQPGPGQPQAGYGPSTGQPAPPLPAGRPEATLPAGPATSQALQRSGAPKLGIGLGALAVAGATGLTYALPPLGIVVAVAALFTLGLRDRIRPPRAGTTGAALIAAAWRVAAAFAAAGVVAWLVETGFELVAKPMVASGKWTGPAGVPATTVLAAFVALTVLLACAVPRWRAPARALAGLVTDVPVLRYVLIAVAVLAIIAALVTPAPAWFPLPIGPSATFGDVLT